MKKIFLIAMLLSVFSVSFLSAKSVVLNVLYFADLVKKSEYTTYADFESVLNYNTIDAAQSEKEEFHPDFVEFTKKQNLYCTPIHLDGIKDKMLSMMNLEGSGGFAYFRIFRFDKKAKKWKIYFSANGAKGECGLVYPVQYKKQTFFLEIASDFDTKRLSSYNLLSLGAKEKAWSKLASARALYSYDLTDEQKEWITAERIEQMAAFDYSFLGIYGDHPQKIEREAGNKKIVAELYWTSVVRLPSNYTIKIFSRPREVFKNSGKTFEDEKEFFALPEIQWGFDIVEKDGKSYLVYIGGEREFSTIEDFWLTVLDLQTLEVVHHSFVKSKITFEREYF